MNLEMNFFFISYYPSAQKRSPNFRISMSFELIFGKYKRNSEFEIGNEMFPKGKVKMAINILFKVRSFVLNFILQGNP